MNGALIIDKPAGITSHDVVARVRKIINERRVGHTGTLDPFATGVLVVLVGRATRLAQFLSGAEKEYEAVIRFGYATDTGDVTGARVESGFHLNAQSLRQDQIETAMASLRGEIEQIPPMYSAKKIGGRKLYELARRGEEVERQPVRVTIREFELLSRDGEIPKGNEDGSVDVRVRVVCSAGTYVRTLAEGLGKKLGTPAHLAELRRTGAGQFTIDRAITLDQLAEASSTQSLAQVLISPCETLSHLPSMELNEEGVRRVIHGLDHLIDGGPAVSWHDRDPICMVQRGELIAVGRFNANRGLIHPSVVVAIE